VHGVDDVLDGLFRPAFGEGGHACGIEQRVRCVDQPEGDFGGAEIDADDSVLHAFL